MSDRHAGATSPFRQPRAVWAVAFACVVSFMGIGLVDPILPALSKQLKASPSSVELLFTSYLVVTAVAMLVTGWVSSRIGGKRTLIVGLVLIVVFSAAAGLSGSIGEIVDFRAGWGLGNAFFIATSLTVIIGAASGGFAGAIVLYETALGLGIAFGPLVGGELGGVSWRGPFFGVTVLMAISLVATLVFVDKTPTPPRRISITEPLRALHHRGLATMSVTALFYNWGFFTLLAFAPFPMHLGIHQLGYVFTGWGVLVAIFAVFVAPRAQARFGTPRCLYVNLFLLSVDLVVIAAFTSSKTTLIIAVIVSGAFVGLNNTLTTQAVMLVSPVEKSVASASYGFVRFIGGGLAPYVASKLAADINVHVPFYVGAGAVAVAIVVLSTGHSLLERAEHGQGDELTVASSMAGDAVASPDGLTISSSARSAEPAPSARSAEPPETGHPAPIVAAIDAGPYAEDVTDAAIQLAQFLACPVEILHILETDVVEEQAVDMEAPGTALAVLADNLGRLRSAGVPGDAHLLRVVGDHGGAGRRIAEYAYELRARMIVIGPPTDQGLVGIFDADLTNELIHHARCDVHIVPAGAVHELSPVWRVAN
ncbi:MAG: multidrug-efflux transporter [Acidimicrobiaceae bacterium]|nr:multidrug-efflux transporter [Acidimicrobiaceae bacterium]